jgi:ParB-like chromosome segregation protein Spo0J
MNDTDEVIDRLIALDELTPHPRNYKKHPASQVEKLAASLQSFGQPRTIAVWRGTILAGHGVTQAAQHLGWQQIRASIVPDSWTEARAQAYVVADNETQRGAEIDEVELAALLDEARLEIDLEAMGFDEAAFDALLAGLTPEGEPVDPADLWKGMPEFEQEDLESWKAIKVHFANEDDYKAFGTLIGQNLTQQTRSTWYPYKEKSSYIDQECADES